MQAGAVFPNPCRGGLVGIDASSAGGGEVVAMEHHGPILVNSTSESTGVLACSITEVGFNAEYAVHAWSLEAIPGSVLASLLH